MAESGLPGFDALAAFAIATMDGPQLRAALDRGGNEVQTAPTEAGARHAVAAGSRGLRCGDPRGVDHRGSTAVSTASFVTHPSRHAMNSIVGKRG